jgi:hypothetical protein
MLFFKLIILSAISSEKGGSLAKINLAASAQFL